MQGVLFHFGGSRLVVVPSFGPKLSNVLPSSVREIRLLVHVLSSPEAECHQPISCSDGKVRDHQRFHEAIRGHPHSIGCHEHKHGVASHELGYMPDYTVLQLPVSTTLDFNL